MAPHCPSLKFKFLKKASTASLSSTLQPRYTFLPPIMFSTQVYFFNHVFSCLWAPAHSILSALNTHFPASSPD